MATQPHTACAVERAFVYLTNLLALQSLDTDPDLKENVLGTVCMNQALAACVFFDAPHIAKLLREVLIP